MQNEPQLSAELPCHLVEKDVYWSLTDADDDYDGYIHLTSVYDGSGMRLSIADVLATALEEQKMKVEVETGLKNFQITMEEIAKARHDERQKVLAEAVKALDNIFDYGMGREQMLEKFEAELRAKLEEMKGKK